MRLQAPRGTEDVLPSEVHLWQRLEAVFREVVWRFGYLEIRTPTFEETELFTRAAGETSDVVSKEMYDFKDKSDRNLTLKPEGTAGVIRAIIEHSLCPPGTVGRFCYITPVFRYERPQKGRYRESHQVGFELVGSASPAADAEVIEATVRFYWALGLGDVTVSLNSIGREECRSRFREAILGKMESLLRDQSEEFRARVEKNPLRLLDSKAPDVQAALVDLPPVLEFLEEDGRARFAETQRLLSDAGIPFRVDPMIVRGLDYYTDTVFEIVTEKLGAQSSLCGGGRYDGMMKELGGSDTPCVGVGMGIERALMVLKETQATLEPPRPDAFVIAATADAVPACVNLARELRERGLAVMRDLDARSLKSQLRQADKICARYALLIGTEELERGVVQVRDLDGGEQRELPLDEAPVRLSERK